MHNRGMRRQALSLALGWMLGGWVAGSAQAQTTPSAASRLADPALYRAPEELRLLNERLAALDKEIAQVMLRWEELERRSAGA